MIENERSTKFANTSKNKNSLIKSIVSDSSLRKWLYYLTDDPDEEPEVSIGAVMDENIIFNKYDENIEQSSRILIGVDALEGLFYDYKSSGEIWGLNIIMPNEYWYIKPTGVSRAFEIANKIAEQIDYQRVAGIGKVTIDEYKTYRINERWTQLTLFLQVVNGNVPVPDYR